MPVSESAIQKAVVRHFEGLGFVSETEYTIQFGSKTGRADVVLYKLTVERLSIRLDQIAAIIECKAQGRVDGGTGQLHSYLCATDTRLGVFANSPSPADWKYYENHGRNDIPEISLMKFLSILRNESEKQEDFQRRIQKRTEQRINQAATQLATEKRIQERATSIINQVAKKRVNEGDFRSATERNLKDQITSLKENQKGCLMSSILVLCGLAAILLITL